MSHDPEIQKLDIKTEQRDAHDETIVELAQLAPIPYGLQRKDAAKKLGVTVTAIDQAVSQAKRDTQASGSRLLFAEIDPCSDRVDGRQLLADVSATVLRYIVMPAHAATAVTLWIVHTYVIDAAYIAPILSIESPQKRCGKSQLLTVINALVFRGLMVSNLSLAALYRAMDKYHPTLLIDEADSFLDDSPELRGIINAGHSRATARTLRVGGENRDELEIFDSFGPKAIAGIGKRRETITDRSIVISLRRRRQDEEVEVLRQDRLIYTDLRGQCAGWAEQNIEELRDRDPDMPTTNDRAVDNWRPLIAIADLCGWGAEARQAALALTELGTDESAAAMLLQDIHTLFTDGGVKRLSSGEIVAALAAMQERPWPEWRQGKPITARQLARLLAPFRIAPVQLKFGGENTRGYRLDQFADSFSRYISTFHPLLRYQSDNGAPCSDFLSATPESQVADENGLQPNDRAKGSGVADKNQKKTVGRF